MRRAVRALLRLHDIPCEAGDCFEACRKLHARMPATTVVWGELAGMAHAWLRLGPLLIDPTFGQLNQEMEGANVPALLVYHVDNNNANSTCTVVLSNNQSYTYEPYM